MRDGGTLNLVVEQTAALIEASPEWRAFWPKAGIEDGCGFGFYVNPMVVKIWRNSKSDFVAFHVGDPLVPMIETAINERHDAEIAIRKAQAAAEYAAHQDELARRRKTCDSDHPWNERTEQCEQRSRQPDSDGGQEWHSRTKLSDPDKADLLGVAAVAIGIWWFLNSEATVPESRPKSGADERADERARDCASAKDQCYAICEGMNNSGWIQSDRTRCRARCDDGARKCW